MRSVRVIIQDTSGTVIPAHAEIAVSFNALIDTSTSVPAPSEVAWNSFGYHYSLVDETTELEAAPQKVGVKIPSVPMLVKQLKGSDGNAFCAEEDVSFRFIIYKGDAVSLPDNYTETDIFNALGETEFTVVTLTVKAGNSTSDLISLGDLHHYEVSEDGTLIQSEKPWTWTNLTRYTLLELPAGNDKYTFGAINANHLNNFTFSYISASTRTLTCTNIRKVWAIHLTKLCDPSQARLSGATFGIYSSKSKDLISNEDFSDLTSGLNETPQTEITKDGITWYLMDIQTSDSNGMIEWAGLTEDCYYILELQAPDGYLKDAEPGRIVSADGNTIVSVTVTNRTCYELPATGGTGIMVYYAFGITAMASALLIGCNRGRKQKKNCATQ